MSTGNLYDLSKENIGPAYVHLLEYMKLKDEQIKRIEARDHLIYYQLVIVGGVLAWTYAHHKEGDLGNLALLAVLIIPWASLILGWTYLVLDDRISAIGEYLRNVAEKMQQAMGDSGGALLGWEVVHRSDAYRVFRKKTQLVIDWLTFVGTGILAIALYGTDQLSLKGDLRASVADPLLWFFYFDVLILIFLFAAFWIFADTKKGK